MNNECCFLIGLYLDGICNSFPLPNTQEKALKFLPRSGIFQEVYTTLNAISYKLAKVTLSCAGKVMSYVFICYLRPVGYLTDIFDCLLVQLPGISMLLGNQYFYRPTYLLRTFLAENVISFYPTNTVLAVPRY